jgi:hypothetical protein
MLTSETDDEVRVVEKPLKVQVKRPLPSSMASLGLISRYCPVAKPRRQPR